MVTKRKNTKFYSTLVFDDTTMKKYMAPATYKSFTNAIKNNKKLTVNLADKVAASMKDWALDMGATHFTHWFQPLNGTTSEKHDSFIVPAGDSGKAIFSFSGKDLISGESDASSFPNGGLRATFEARGYTAWDPTSNAFIKDEVLCIPTAFCSYNGQALDKKTPLLRSMDAIKFEVKQFMKHFGGSSNDIVVNVGAEQEFFLIPKNDYKAREDLVMCGRTLFGNSPVKGQELEEHYYGCLRPTVSAYMKELDDELWALGIAAHTKHNEAAPSQHELAPIFTNANRAIDENLITMEKMQLLASKYDLACLLHEKPFDGINGSGKHCNWSVTSDGHNLLSPGKNGKESLRFLAFLSCVISAVDKYQDVIRASVASIGNDCRLGGNEAPPAIISIYLGEALDSIIQQVIAHESYDTLKNSQMNLGASALPNIMRDSSDRNRTSPFAFSANKFEFRMPGSQMNVSECVMVLNTAVADSLHEFNKMMNCSERISANKVKHEKQVLRCCSKILKQHRRIIFNGDGYSKQWPKEAKRRGLVNNKNTAQALPCWLKKKNIELFEKYKVLSKQEIESRYIISLEVYNKLVNIECRLMHRMAFRTYMPAINKYAASVALQIKKYNAAIKNPKVKDQKRALNKLLAGLESVNATLRELDKLCELAKKIKNEQKKADFNADRVLPAMARLRKSVDEMEHIVSRDYWPVPSYNNMLFYV